MKKIKLEKLDFKKSGIIELNNQELQKINGGDSYTDVNTNGPGTRTTANTTKAI